MFNFNDLTVLYVDRNGYSEQPYIKICFESIKRTFPEAKFVNLPLKYIKRAEKYDIHITSFAWKSLYGRLEYIKDHPTTHIVSVELDVFIPDKNRIRSFVSSIFERKQSYYFGTDAFMVSYNSFREVSRMLSISYTRYRFDFLSPWILYLKKYPKETNIEQSGNYFYHFGDLNIVLANAKSLYLIKDNIEKLTVSYLPNTIVLQLSYSDSGRYLIYAKNSCDGPTGCWLVHPIIFGSVILYIKSINPNIVVKNITSRDFNLLCKKNYIPAKIIMASRNFVFGNTADSNNS